MEEGIYTGKRLANYFGPHVDDPVDARRIINGLDKAQEIAGFYHAFLGALRGAS
jgi:putative chitinase